MLKLKVPPSKSLTHRALLAAALADGQSRLSHPLLSDDTRATATSLEKLGAQISWSANSVIVTGPLATSKNEIILNCGESGTTFRFLSALAGLAGLNVLLEGAPGLLSRPSRPLIDVFRQMEIPVEQKENGALRFGKSTPRGNTIRLDGSTSSQFLSGLLLAAPVRQVPLEIEITGEFVSKSYVQITLDVMRRFGVNISQAGNSFVYSGKGKYSPVEMEIEGDYSSAAFLMAAAVLSGKETVLDGLTKDSAQGDRAAVDYLRNMGAVCEFQNDALRVQPNKLTPLRADFTDTPDLAPIFAVLAAFADGESTFIGLERLRHKESDRPAFLVENLRRMGVRVEYEGGVLRIGGGKPRAANIVTAHDHRLSMSFQVARLILSDIAVDDERCVAKSFPGFQEMLRAFL